MRLGRADHRRVRNEGVQLIRRQLAVARHAIKVAARIHSQVIGTAALIAEGLPARARLRKRSMWNFARTRHRARRLAGPPAVRVGALPIYSVVVILEIVELHLASFAVGQRL